MNKIRIETIEQFKQDFSQEVFDKASKSFLKKNILIPCNIEDGCLYVITAVDSNLDEMGNLKLIYSCKSIAEIKVSNEVFSEIFEFCFGSLYISKAEQERAERERAERSQLSDEDHFP